MTESIIEQAALAWPKRLSFMVKDAPDITPAELGAVVQACLVHNSVDEK